MKDGKTVKKPDKSSNAMNIAVSISVFLILILSSEMICRVLTGDKFVLNSEVLFAENTKSASVENKKNFAGYAYGADIFTDGNGFRVPKDYASKEHSFESSLLILGDSVSFGYWLEEEKTVAGLIRTAFPSLEVLNSSVIGYSTRDYGYVVSKIFPARSRIKQAYLFFCLNDVIPTSSLLINEKVKKEDRVLDVLRNIKSMTFIDKIHYYLYNHSKLYLMIRAIVTNPPLRDWNEISYLYRDENEDFLNNQIRPVIDIAAVFRKKGIPFTVIIVPFRAQFTNKELYPQKRLSALFRKNKVDHIDAYKVFEASKAGPGELFLFMDSMHLSPLGHEVIFDRLKKRIVMQMR